MADEGSRSPEDERGADGSSVGAFLIADVRGYTLFTQQHGDEAAAKLAAKFAGVARESIEGRGGRLLELRGDEALAVFGSPRGAIRAAMDLQERFVEETVADPEIPLLVGIGMDAGEAVPVEGGYRGGALNLAARLCGLAGPGEVLASRELAHLARRMDGVTYEDAGDHTLKGIAEPVRVIRLVPATGTDPRQRLEPFRPSAPPATPSAKARRSRPRVIVTLIAAAMAVALIAVAIPMLAGRGSAKSLTAVEANSLGLVDPTSGRIIAAIPLKGTPGRVAVGAGSWWVTNPGNDSVIRVDPDGRAVVDTVPVGDDPNGIAASNEAVWVANSGGGSVSRIDPKTGQVVGTYPVGNGPFAVTVGLGGVWVANRTDDTVVKLDPLSGRIVGTVAVGGSPTALAVGDGGVWVSNSASATVSRIDPGSMSVSQTVTVGNGPGSLALSRGAVWVANSLDGTVSKVDPDSASVAATVPVGDGPSGVAFVGGSLWVGNTFGNDVVTLNGPSNSVGRRLSVGNVPVDLGQGGGFLLVPVRSGPAGHRGGTLNLVSDAALDTVDPAVSYFELTWQILTMTNDGLVAFERVGGAEGATLVPDLATSLPAPTDNGTSYTFQLRRGIVYSTGIPVRASDVRRALERMFEVKGPRPDFYQGIVGADACTAKPTSCNLDRGIQTNDTQGTITFHLTTPDTEFLFKLALPFSFPVPPGTPATPVSTPVPATGPYMISGYDPKQPVTLVRNPRFHEWSAAAQPDGFPDRIVLRTDVPDERGADMVERGQADWAYGGVPPDRLEEMRTRFGSQLHGYPAPAAFYMHLNTRVAPFDDPRVRQAINFAVDRRHVVDLAGGTEQATLTCQVLPPNYPGYRPYCPYTSNPQPDGTWSGPDVGRAKKLIGASKTRGMPIVVWAGTGLPGAEAIGRYFVSLLSSLGYQASLHYVADTPTYFRTVYDPRQRIQIAVNGWSADYISAFGFIGGQLTCAAYQVGPNNSNASGFCDPRVEALIKDAQEVQEADPAAAADAWTGVDRAITDAAPYVSLLNPRGYDFVSARVGNWEHHPQWGLLLDQLWVK